MKRRSAFTLVEILIVLAIISILAAILFPAFGRARESGRETSCATNLHQVYMAVELYYQDVKRYPGALSDLLNHTNNLNNTGGFDVGGAANAGATSLDTNGGDYYKGGLDNLICPNDGTESTVPRSSYGDLSNDEYSPAVAQAAKDGLVGGSGAVDTSVDPARYVWNTYGYDPSGFAYDYNGAANAAAANPNLLANSAGTFGASNPFKYSLWNRYAPTGTVITHCIYHRGWSGESLSAPGQLYQPGIGNGARDIVLRLDGTAKSIDVSGFQTSGNINLWQQSTN